MVNPTYSVLLTFFFNGLVEPNKSVNFTRDYFERAPRKRKKKEISISVEFDLIPTIHLRKELLKIQSTGSPFTITRTWELDKLRVPFDTVKIEKNGEAVPDSSSIARQFLSLIFYRYIPNRSIPSELLKAESQEIANSIFMRMKGDTHASALLDQLIAASNRMLQNAADSLISAGSPLTTPSLATPASMVEMLTMTGFKASGSHGADVQDEDWGAGHQAFFLYQVLHSLDTNYARFFGWRQATIWGVEEPESALHRDLESRLADQLRQWSQNQTSRLQILQTTHSPILTMASDTGYWTDLNKGATILSPMPIQKLTREAESKGVSGWVHPILSFPWNPIVIVEGSIDMKVLTHVSSIAGLHHFKFFTVPGLDRNEDSSGKDAVIAYLKRNAGLAQNRPVEVPLLVVFDWEISEQELKKARAAYGPNADKFVMRMNSVYCDVKMGEDFKGIERFYPLTIVESASKAGDLIVGIVDEKPCSVSKSQLGAAKGKLLTRVMHEKSQKKLEPLIRVLLDLERAIRGEGAIQLTLFDPTPAKSGA